MDTELNVVAAHPELEKDNDYYLEFAEFVVEDRLYRVPVNQFNKEPSSFWAIVKPWDYVGGPIVLEGIRRVDFVALLKLLCPYVVGDGKPENLDEWKSILELTHKWRMYKLFEKAMEALQKAPLGDQVVLARKYGVYTWLKTAYVALAERDTFLTGDEATALGLEAVLKLAHIREHCMGKLLSSRYSDWPDPPSLNTRFDGATAIRDERNMLEEVVDARPSLSAIDQVMLGRKHRMSQWVELGYRALAYRKEPISLDEAMKLGPGITLDLCNAREPKVWRDRGYLQWSPAMFGVDIPAEVVREFEKELNDLGKINGRYGKPPHVPAQAPQQTGISQVTATPSNTGGHRTVPLAFPPRKRNRRV